MKDFDLVRASFLLVAFVIAAQVLSSLMVLGYCMAWYWQGDKAADFSTCSQGKVGEILAAALAAALAFAGARIVSKRNGNGDDKKE